MTRTLNMAEPTIVPEPIDTSHWLILLSAKIAVKSSGALEPIAISVAHATSSFILNLAAIDSSDGTKISSQTRARPQKHATIAAKYTSIMLGNYSNKRGCEQNI